MASTYTTNTGIELIATGEQSGTWGSTTNTNLQIIDRLTNGVGAITLSGTTHTLTTSDGTLSDGQYAVLVFGGTPSGTNTVTISPNDQNKLYVVKNNSGESVVLTQGSGGNVTVADGKSAIVYADGAGSGAEVVDITSTFNFQPLTATLTAIGALPVTDDNIIVGNGSTWVAESGATARTSLGLGTGDSPTFTAVTAGQVDITGTVTAGQVDITGTGDLRLQDTSGGQYVALQAPSVVSSNYTLTLPAADGSNGQVLATNGSGVLSFQDSSGGSVVQTKLYTAVSTGTSGTSDWASAYWNERTSSGTITDRTPTFIQSNSSNWTRMTFTIPRLQWGAIGSGTGSGNVVLRSTTNTATTSSQRSLITTTEYSVLYSANIAGASTALVEGGTVFQVFAQITTQRYFDVFIDVGASSFVIAYPASGSGVAIKDSTFTFEEIAL